MKRKTYVGFVARKQAWGYVCMHKEERQTYTEKISHNTVDDYKLERRKNQEISQ